MRSVYSTRSQSALFDASFWLQLCQSQKKCSTAYKIASARVHARFAFRISRFTQKCAVKKAHILTASSITVIGILFLSSILLGVDGRKPTRIFFTANRQGEIDPCRCQTNQVGGLARMRTLLKRESRAMQLVVDSGDSFFSHPTLNSSRRAQAIDRAKVIGRSYRLMKLNLLTPGERDFAAGIETLRELREISGATFVSTNILDTEGKPLFEPFAILEIGNTKYGVLSLMDEGLLKGYDGIRVAPPKEALKKTLLQLKEKGATVFILLSHLGLMQDREIASEGGVDIILGSHSMDVLLRPEVVNHVLIAQPHNEGQQVGVLDYVAEEPGRSNYRLVELGEEFEEENDVQKLIEEHKKMVRELALHSDTATFPGTKPYVANVFVCRKCHLAQVKAWEKTHHASAYLVLFSKNQHFNPECISCHSLGFQEMGGFQSIAKPIVLKKEETPTEGEAYVESVMKRIFAGDFKKGPLDSKKGPERYQKIKQRYHGEMEKISNNLEALYIGVQCEHCHGNRQDHPGPRVPVAKKVSEHSCRTCHAPPNDPHFDFKSVAKIACNRKTKKK